MDSNERELQDKLNKDDIPPKQIKYDLWVISISKTSNGYYFEANYKNYLPYGGISGEGHEFKGNNWRSSLSKFKKELDESKRENQLIR